MDSGNAVLDVDLFTMSNLSPKRTGLPFVVWISPKGGAQHDVRVKVTRGPKAIPGEFVTVTVRPRVEVIDGSLPAGDLELLLRWIKRNRDILVQFCDGAIEYTEDVLEQLRPLE